MLGWELAPYNTGGLGVASLGLTQALAPMVRDIHFFLPDYTGSDSVFSHMNVIGAAGASGVTAPSLLPTSYSDFSSVTHEHSRKALHHGPAAFSSWYAQASVATSNQIHGKTSPEIIHAHDWMTYEAAQRVQDTTTSTPFVAHIHATEFDRAGGSEGHPAIHAIEQAGLTAADKVIAVSGYTAQIVNERYKIPSHKIAVIHNGVDQSQKPLPTSSFPLKGKHPVVLFIGRVTTMKGPEHFLRAAATVHASCPQARFLFCGSGDLEARTKELAAQLGLTGSIIFSPFLRGSDVQKAYAMADVVVIPSRSEPFGLVAVEAIQQGTPIVLTKQSGAAEVLPTVAQADHWDEALLAKHILTLISEPEVARAQVASAQKALTYLSWERAAKQVRDVYDELLHGAPVLNLAS
jgi:glycosyltransferase involved in cell wall biosynthesis